MSTLADFEKTLQMYRTNLLEYKITGNVAYKTASDTAKQWLDKYIDSMSTDVNQGKKEIEDFVKDHAKSGSEMATFKQDMSAIRKNGPELQMIYETERESQEAPPIDFGIYYTKGAVLGGIIVLAGVASMF